LTATAAVVNVDTNGIDLAQDVDDLVVQVAVMEASSTQVTDANVAPRSVTMSDPLLVSWTDRQIVDELAGLVQ
jgi:hypothetical protein